MPKFRVPMWRTIEVVETGHFDVEADNAEAAKAIAIDKLKLCEMPANMTLGDTVGTNHWDTEEPVSWE